MLETSGAGGPGTRMRGGRIVSLWSTCWLLGGCAEADLDKFKADFSEARAVLSDKFVEATGYLSSALGDLLAQTGYTFSDLFGDPASKRAAYEQLARIEGCEHAVEIIQEASEATQVSANFLLALARQESGCRSDARASTSSAYGMFQFIESTWLVAIHEHGAKYDERHLAEAVAIDVNGRPVMRNPAMREEVLAKRGDAQLAAFLAAELALENAAYIRRHRRAQLTATDLYMAHFLGAHGAREFLLVLDREPGRHAHEVMPRAADANPSVFFERGNRARPRSVAGVYGFFQQKIEVA